MSSYSCYTCITCRVTFVDAELQRAHYKTDWHRYNLKRKVAELPAVTAESFKQRVLTQKTETEEVQVASYCEICSKHFNTKNAFENHIQSNKHKEAVAKHDARPTEKPKREKARTVDEKVAEKNVKNLAMQQSDKNLPSTSSKAEPAARSSQDAEMDSDGESVESWEGEALGIEECLFCSHVSGNLEDNVQHMCEAHSFFIPDMDFLTDLEGLVQYLGEKVGEGHICLWCNEKGKSFWSTKSVQQHMVDKGHCKMLHDGDVVFEYSDFYDYSSSYPDEEGGGDEARQERAMEEEQEVMPEVMNDTGYELVLPSGSLLGHRSLQRYYRQNLRPDRVHNPSAVSRVLASYKALGWTGCTGSVAVRKAKDMAFIQRIKSKQLMKLGRKANKFQPHFRDDNCGIRH